MLCWRHFDRNTSVQSVRLADIVGLWRDCWYKSYQCDDTHFIIQLKWLEGVFLCLHLMNLSLSDSIALLILMQITISKQMTDFVRDSFSRAEKSPHWVLFVSSARVSLNGSVFKACTNGELHHDRKTLTNLLMHFKLILNYISHWTLDCKRKDVVIRPTW